MLTSERAGTDTVGRYPPSLPQYARNRQCWFGGATPRNPPRTGGLPAPPYPPAPRARGAARAPVPPWPSAAGELGQDLDDGRVGKDQVGRYAVAGGRAVHQERRPGEHRAQPAVVPAPGHDDVQCLRERARLDRLQLSAGGLPG